MSAPGAATRDPDLIRTSCEVLLQRIPLLLVKLGKDGVLLARKRGPQAAPVIEALPGTVFWGVTVGVAETR